MTEQIFISYSKKDSDFAHKLADNLESTGFKVWIDRSIGGGDLWRATIEKNLKASSEAIIVVSTNSMASDWVRHEGSLAYGWGKKLIPILIEPVPSLPPWLEEYQWIDFAEKSYQEAFEALVTTLTPPNPIQDLLDQQVQIYQQTGELIGEAILRVIDEARETLAISDEAKELIEKSLKVIEERQQRERQLLEESERHTQQIILLNKIGRNLTSNLDLPIILNQVLEYAIDIVKCQAGTLFIMDEETGELIFEYVKGPLANNLIGKRIPPGSGYVGQVVETRRPMIVNEVHVDEAWPQVINGHPEFKPRDLIVIPMCTKDRVVGVIEVINRIDGLPFNENDQDLLTVFSDQAAIAIENSKLFNDLQRSNLELLMAYDATIEGWSRALELRDRDTEGHSVRVTDMTLQLAQSMGLHGDELVHIRRGALLHDIGKIGISDWILHKPGPLNDDELNLMRLHPSSAYEILSPIAFLRPALNIPYCHHEKWDGTGYPRGLKGEEIPLAARIFAVVDVYDNLVSDKPYRAGWNKDKALEYIREQSGKHFDPEVVKIFLTVMGNKT